MMNVKINKQIVILVMNQLVWVPLHSLVFLLIVHIIYVFHLRIVLILQNIQLLMVIWREKHLFPQMDNLLQNVFMVDKMELSVLIQTIVMLIIIGNALTGQQIVNLKDFIVQIRMIVIKLSQSMKPIIKFNAPAKLVICALKTQIVIKCEIIDVHNHILTKHGQGNHAVYNLKIVIKKLRANQMV